MKNSVSSFVFTIVMLFSFNLSAQYDFQDMTQVLASKDGQKLTMLHATVYVNFMKSTGDIPNRPSPTQIATQINDLVQSFQMMPTATVGIVENYAALYPATLTPLTPTSTAAAPRTKTVSHTGGKSAVEQRCDQKQPGHGMLFNTSETAQVKRLLNGAVASRSKSSFSGGEYYVGTNATITIEFCPNGTFTWTNSSDISAGGGGGLSADSSTSRGEWDIATYNGHYLLVMYMPEMMQEVGTDLVPVPIEGIGHDYLSAFEENFRLTANSASCW